MRAAEPAVRAAERALVAGSPALLANTLAIAFGAETRRRLAPALELKARAERDPGRRERRGRPASRAEVRAPAATR